MTVKGDEDLMVPQNRLLLKLLFSVGDTADTPHERILRPVGIEPVAALAVYASANPPQYPQLRSAVAPTRPVAPAPPVPDNAESHAESWPPIGWLTKFERM